LGPYIVSYRIVSRYFVQYRIVSIVFPHGHIVPSLLFGHFAYWTIRLRDISPIGQFAY